MPKLTGEPWIMVANDLPRQSMVHHNFLKKAIATLAAAVELRGTKPHICKSLSTTVITVV